MAAASWSLTGVRSRKRFGQHFLTDRQILERIAQFGCAGHPRNLLEIGPGYGALTEVLLERVGQVTAVELDRDLIPELERRFPPDSLHLVSMDILDCDLSTLPRPCPDVPFRVVGNLPYNISTPLLFHLLAQLSQIDAMIFMVQKEVAMRLVATPGGKAYGRLTVMTALELACEVLFDIPPTAFSPPPKVDSSLIRLVPLPQPLTRERHPVQRLVTAAFSHRRKTLRNTLRDHVTMPDFDAAGIDPTLRAEALTPADYVRLASVIKASRSPASFGKARDRGSGPLHPT